MRRLLQGFPCFGRHESPGPTQTKHQDEDLNQVQILGGWVSVGLSLMII